MAAAGQVLTAIAKVSDLAADTIRKTGCHIHHEGTHVMAVNIDKPQFLYWLELLQNLWQAHKHSGTPLRDDLGAEVEAANLAFPALVNRFYTLKSTDRQLRRQAADIQAQGRAASRAVHHSLVCVNPQRADTVLALYQVVHQPPTQRLHVLSQLQHIVHVAAEQSEATMKPEAEVLTRVTTLAEELRQKVDAVTDNRTEIESNRNDLVDAVLQNRLLRKRVHSYLLSKPELGHNHPVLLEYGLRKKVRNSPSVTVVDEELVEVAPA